MLSLMYIYLHSKQYYREMLFSGFFPHPQTVKVKKNLKKKSKAENKQKKNTKTEITNSVHESYYNFNRTLKIRVPFIDCKSLYGNILLTLMTDNSKIHRTYILACYIRYFILISPISFFTCWGMHIFLQSSCLHVLKSGSGSFFLSHFDSCGST